MSSYFFVFILLVLKCTLAKEELLSTKPNIILMMADDMGWDDVGFHGSNVIKTPNIDALAYHGVILNRHYVQPTCTPSRAALLTGKYPIRLGLQGTPLVAFEKRGLPLNETLLPEYLKKLGYETHLIGKWHLGYHKKDFLPTERGFDSHFGCYNGWITYHNCTCTANRYTGYDARRNTRRAKDEFEGKYATEVFTHEALEIIRKHNKKNPLFLEIAHTAPHAVRGNILQVPDEKKTEEEFKYIPDKQRRLYAGMMKSLDQSVGEVIQALEKAQLLQNSIIIFIADNGGASRDTLFLMENRASNWPLRGMKFSVTEGGVRGVGVIWSSRIKMLHSVSNRNFHITDWLPTLYSAAGGDISDLQGIDGIDQWEYLSEEPRSSSASRIETLLNIDEVEGQAAIIYNNWKLIINPARKMLSYSDLYDGLSEREGVYDISSVMRSLVNKALEKHKSTHGGEENTEKLFANLRTEATITAGCEKRIAASGRENYSSQCFRSACLFHIEKDPCEFTDLTSTHPHIVSILKERLEYYKRFLVKQIPLIEDPKSNPALWGGYWTPWVIN